LGFTSLVILPIIISLIGGVEVEGVHHGNYIRHGRLEIIISELIFYILNQEVSNIFNFIICEFDILEI
jgi:hypothetical protein